MQCKVRIYLRRFYERIRLITQEHLSFIDLLPHLPSWAVLDFGRIYLNLFYPLTELFRINDGVWNVINISTLGHI